MGIFISDMPNQSASTSASPRNFRVRAAHLRFDDTNPSKEDQEYVDSIQEDIRWLGFDWGDNLFFASNMFDFFYECAVSLIRKGLAYVDEQTVEEIRAQRGNVNVPGQESPYRNRSVEETWHASRP